MRWTLRSRNRVTDPGRHPWRAQASARGECRAGAAWPVGRRHQATDRADRNIASAHHAVGGAYGWRRRSPARRARRDCAMSLRRSRVAARGAPLVLLHGWGLNSLVWDSIVPAARAQLHRAPHRSARTRRELVAARVSRSASRWLQRLLPALPATLVAAWLVAWRDGSTSNWPWRHAGAIDRLVLVSTTPRFMRDDDWPHGLACLRPSSDLRRLLESDYEATVREFLGTAGEGRRARARHAA